MHMSIMIQMYMYSCVYSKSVFFGGLKILHKEHLPQISDRQKVSTPVFQLDFQIILRHQDKTISKFFQRFYEKKNEREE